MNFYSHKILQERIIRCQRIVKGLKSNRYVLLALPMRAFFGSSTVTNRAPKLDYFTTYYCDLTGKCSSVLAQLLQKVCVFTEFISAVVYQGAFEPRCWKLIEVNFCMIAANAKCSFIKSFYWKWNWIKDWYSYLY